jgi:hypothetical protein
MLPHLFLANNQSTPVLKKIFMVIQGRKMLSQVIRLKWLKPAIKGSKDLLDSLVKES